MIFELQASVEGKNLPRDDSRVVEDKDLPLPSSSLL